MQWIDELKFRAFAWLMRRYGRIQACWLYDDQLSIIKGTNHLAVRLLITNTFKEPNSDRWTSIDPALPNTFPCSYQDCGRFDWLDPRTIEAEAFVRAWDPNARSVDKVWVSGPASAISIMDTKFIYNQLMWTKLDYMSPIMPMKHNGLHYQFHRSDHYGWMVHVSLVYVQTTLIWVEELLGQIKVIDNNVKQVKELF